MYDFFSGYFKKHPLVWILIAAGIVVLALIFSSLSGPRIKKRVNYTSSTIPDPFAGMPEIKISSSSGAVTSPKTDWSGGEAPSFEVNLNKLQNATSANSRK